MLISDVSSDVCSSDLPSQQRHALCSHRDAGDDDSHSEGPGWTADGRSGGILDRRSFHFPSSILVSLNEKTSAGIVAIALTACFDRRIIFCNVSLSLAPAVSAALDLFQLLRCPGVANPMIFGKRVEF